MTGLLVEDTQVIPEHLEAYSRSRSTWRHTGDPGAPEDVQVFREHLGSACFCPYKLLCSCSDDGFGPMFVS